jgi:DNA-3-methyladenine glycosylase
MGSSIDAGLKGGRVVTIIRAIKRCRLTPGTLAGPLQPLARTALPDDTVAMARFLLGKLLVRVVGGAQAIGRIVETEAYLPDDPACHAYRGITPRNRSLFLGAGHAYVYICYGTSFLLNVSNGGRGVGSGVLLRALEPMAGIDLMQCGRARIRLRDIARGPGRLTAAMQVDRRHDGMDLFSPGPLWIGSDGAGVDAIGQSVRIGITQAADLPLRYFIAGSGFLSGTKRLNAIPA